MTELTTTPQTAITNRFATSTIDLLVAATILVSTISIAAMATGDPELVATIAAIGLLLGLLALTVYKFTA